MKIAVTGASGYIGQRLINLAYSQGYRVLALGRKPLTCSAVEWMHFDLTQDRSIDLPDDVDVVFHLAVGTQSAEYTEEAAAARLLAAAARVQARFVFVSSQTARANAPTAYGRTKWRIEQATLAAEGWVIRPGQVYGGPEQGLFGVLVQLVRQLPILPAFLPSPYVQPIHVDDLAKGILACVARDLPSGVFNVGEAIPLSFTHFLSSIAKGRLRRQRVFFPIPVVLVKAASFLLGPKLTAHFGLDRLSSLFALPFMETDNDLRRLGIKPRPLGEGMTRSGKAGRRWLSLEGHTFLTYVLREPPASVLVRRYVRCVEQLREVGALDVPRLVFCFPHLVAMLEGGALFQGALRDELVWRLNAAVMLAEATGQGARRFLLLGKRQGVLINSLRILRGIGCEIICRIVRICINLFAKKRGERQC